MHLRNKIHNSDFRHNLPEAAAAEMAQKNMGMVKLFGRNIKVGAEGEYKKQEESSIPSEEDHSSVVPEKERSSSTASEVFKPDGEKEEHDDGGSNSQENTLKKPEKILPCPRCNSVDTKFCYYNNYNVNQPRHFCRDCQRYWTAGGSMRNVPVGAGRRKNKSPTACNYHQIPITSSPSAGVSMVQSEIPNQTSATVLSFGPDMTVCKPTAMVNIHCSRNTEGDEHSCGSSVTASNSNSTEDRAGSQKLQSYSLGPPWIYPCNPNPPPNLPMTFCPAAPPHWGFAVPGAWSIPWMPSQFSLPNSPLGKHSRYGYILNQSINSDHDANKKCQKMRTDNSSEASEQKSAWLTMGTENSKSDGLFKGFHPKDKASSDTMHPNPAALSRSLCFREST